MIVAAPVRIARVMREATMPQPMEPIEAVGTRFEIRPGRDWSPQVEGRVVSRAPWRWTAPPVFADLIRQFGPCVEIARNEEG